MYTHAQLAATHMSGAASQMQSGAAPVEERADRIHLL